MDSAKLRRSQIDRFFATARNLFYQTRPKEGWIKEIRQALGMTVQDLADRLGVIRQRVSRIEADEISGKLTLETVKKVANALNCDFAYFLIPRKSLDDLTYEAAIAAAKKIIADTEHTMRMEAQPTSKQSQQKAVEELAQKLYYKGDRKVWKKK